MLEATPPTPLADVLGLEAGETAAGGGLFLCPAYQLSLRNVQLLGIVISTQLNLGISKDLWLVSTTKGQGKELMGAGNRGQGWREHCNLFSDKMKLVAPVN